MKRILEIGVYKSGNLRVEVVDLSNLEEAVNEDTAVFVGHTTVTRQTNGQNFSSSYRISRAYLKQHARWRMVASQRIRVAHPDMRVATRGRTAAA